MNRHTLNTDFNWEDREGPFRILTAAQASQYNQEGFFVIDDVFDEETIAGLIEEIDPVEAEFERVVTENFGGKIFIARSGEITFTTHLVTHSEKARAFTQSAFFKDLCFDLLGSDVRLYWDQAVYKKPNNEEIFPWHQDNGYTYVEPQQYLTCWVALTDADEENGCPWVIPKVHRKGTLEHRLTDLGFECFGDDPPESVKVPVRAGGVVVFSSLTPHKTGPNFTTDRIRKSYIVQFAPEGAEMVKLEEGVQSRSLCAEPGRQFAILIDGKAPSQK